ncbi:ABC transporter ATP-binding protein [Alkalicoccus daliensis]|uniref:ABC-2 type transport system ATP-binding protein n=1 Tax=Alkalicoccus daliensis TaxID=745820 RepID=A0A1H0GSU3_9BACI|nr:ABC transporter ATP-binding protein [Alkalicoccus daliensis]SDO09930.1 ABC-2 type transport system ATP-binding protein [Alkalicoccus daliensis]
MMNITEISKQFGDVKAVDGVSMNIAKDRCTALLGPNGAGKTTLLSIVTGLLPADQGSVTLEMKVKDRREVIGYLPQFPSFYTWMSGEEYVIYSAKLCGLTHKKAKSKAEELLSLTGLSDSRHKRISGYSGGMKQRLGIAQALVNEPALLILDEPVSALDPIGRREVLQLLQKLKAHTSILFSTHVLGDAELVSDDVYMMKNGRLIMEGSLKSLKQKYEQPAFLVEAYEDLTTFGNKIKEAAWVRSVIPSESGLRLEVTSLQEARKGLLEAAVKENIAFTKIEAGAVSLEDLFMQVMES